MSKFWLVLFLLSSQAHAEMTVETDFGRRHGTGYLGLGKNPVYTDEVFSTVDLPLEFDWRDYDVVTSVKDQKQCGSCVSFALSKAFEGAMAVQLGVFDMNVAEQEILSCRKGDAYGCNGAQMTAAGYLVSKGIGAETDFPYVARAVSCKKIPNIGKASSYLLLGTSARRPAKDEIKAALMKYGPMFITVQAGGSGWSGRTGKVTSCKRTSSANHAVTLIGWDKTGWIIRNSWGASWGAKGDSWIGYNCDGIAGEAGYFVVE